MSNEWSGKWRPGEFRVCDGKIVCFDCGERIRLFTINAFWRDSLDLIVKGCVGCGIVVGVEELRGQRIAALDDDALFRRGVMRGTRVDGKPELWNAKDFATVFDDESRRQFPEECLALYGMRILSQYEKDWV